LLLAAWVLLALVVLPVDSDAVEGYQIVVNAKNSSTSVSREFLSDVFLKRATSWESSDHATPVDLPAASPVRRAFSRQVLGRSVAAVRAYWTQRIFSGRDVPPPELQSEDAVLRYVASHPGAVGYVSSGITFPGTKPLAVR
jgi:ABC-type phosphate transport system substrate-binding protein